jgi:RHS repeat-associated protein
MPRSQVDDRHDLRQSRTVLLATDKQSSVIAKLAGDKPGAIAYTAYGQQSAQQQVVMGLGFNGELCEARLGWYLLGNGYRAYNPTLMRFHSPDSLSPFGKGGLNSYAYCLGDPLNLSDSSGHIPYFSDIFVNLFRRINRRIPQTPTNAPTSAHPAPRTRSNSEPNLLTQSSPNATDSSATTYSDVYTVRERVKINNEINRLKATLSHNKDIEQQYSRDLQTYNKAYKEHVQRRALGVAGASSEADPPSYESVELKDHIYRGRDIISIDTRLLGELEIKVKTLRSDKR